jgi:hypothetical protein
MMSRLYPEWSLFFVVDSYSSCPLQIRWLGYSLATAYIVIVMVALAEELLALLTLLVTSLWGVPVSAIEMAASVRPNRIKPASMTARMVKKNSLCTSTSS